jgi:hypothetical protein
LRSLSTLASIGRRLNTAIFKLHAFHTHGAQSERAEASLFLSVCLPDSLKEMCANSRRDLHCLGPLSANYKTDHITSKKYFKAREPVILFAPV